MTQNQSYDRMSQLFHWILAAAIVLLILYHPSTEEGHAPASALTTSIHASLGTLALLLVLGRMVWRVHFAQVPATPEGANWQLRLRRYTHLALYLFMLSAPILGAAVSLSTEFPVRVFGLVEIPRMLSSESAHGLLRSLHGFSADLLLYLGSLHIAAALYHQYWLRDNLMGRMMD
jgi:cytochrome b561